MFFFIIEGVVFSFLAGLTYGLFGGGSGIFLMPCYVYLLSHFPSFSGIEMQMAVTTTATTTVILGIPASLLQLKSKYFNKSLFKIILSGTFLGAIMAVIIVNYLSTHTLKALFGFLVLGVGVWMYCYKQETDKSQWSILGYAHFCRSFVIGLIWFLLGVAIFMVPYLQKCGRRIQESIAVSTIISTVLSAIISFILIISSVSKLSISTLNIGYLCIPLFLVSILPSMLGVTVGSRLANILSGHTLKKLYGVIISFAGLLMLIQ